MKFGKRSNHQRFLILLRKVNPQKGNNRNCKSYQNQEKAEKRKSGWVNQLASREIVRSRSGEGQSSNHQMKQKNIIGENGHHTSNIASWRKEREAVQIWRNETDVGRARQINRLKDGAGIEETGKIKGKRQKQAGQAKKSSNKAQK